MIYNLYIYEYVMMIMIIMCIYIFHLKYLSTCYTSCLGLAVQTSPSEGANTQWKRTENGDEFTAGKFEDIGWVIVGESWHVYCIWYENREILLFINGWMKNVTLSTEGFPLVHPNTWKLECYQQKQGCYRNWHVQVLQSGRTSGLPSTSR